MVNNTLMQFQPSPILEFPNSLYRYFSPDFIRSRQIDLYQNAVAEIQKTGTLSSDSVDILRWYSRILEYILRIPELNGKVKSMLAVESPYAGFNAVISDYASPVSQILELSLLSKPEYVCKLLIWAFENKISLRYPLPVYYAVLFNDFYWSFHYYSRRPVDYFYERFVKHQVENKETSPNAILCLALLRDITNVEDYVSVLAQDYTVAFQAALFFPNQLSLEGLLFEAALEAPWAFHILSYLKNAPTEIVEMCQATLDYNPPWLLEYLHKSNLLKTDPLAARKRFKDALQNSAHPLCKDLTTGIIFPKQ